MKVAVIGSRSVNDKALVEQMLNEIKRSCDSHNNSLVILAGGASGVDELARQWAKDNHVDFVMFKPYFMLDSKASYTPRHYFFRNKQIIQNADTILAIWDGESNGTRFGIEYAKKHKKDITVVTTK